MSIKFEYRDIDSLIPYENNPRKHTSIKRLEKSVEEYGFINPIIIDEDDVILSGHGRLMAARKEGLEQVPCIRVDHLDEEGKIGFRIADNSSAEESEWDQKKLKLELEKIDFKMDEFKLDFDEPEEEIDWQETTRDRADNILNLEVGQFEGEGYYDIPIIKGIKKMPEVREWIGFNYVMSDKDPEGKGVHFFVDDYQFERIWNDPVRYMEKLKRYEAVLSPDFSPYGDMPLATQLWNHYRKHWCAAYWQANGITVIPTIRCSTDPRSMDWFLDGEPRNSVIAISSLGTIRDMEDSDETYNFIIRELEPKHIIIYGDLFDFMKKDLKKITNIPKFTEKRFKSEV